MGKVCEGKEKQEFDKEILIDYKPRYPRKSPEEFALIEKIHNRIEELIKEDFKLVLNNEGQAASTELMSELSEGTTPPSKLYYEGAGQEALDKWRSLSEEERKAL